MSDEWLEWKDSDENEQNLFQSIFDSTVCKTVDELIEHDLKITKGQFNLKNFIAQVARSYRDLDEYSVIKFINYARLARKEQESAEEFAQRLLGEDNDQWTDEKYLFPSLPQDALLTVNFTSLFVILEKPFYEVRGLVSLSEEKEDKETELLHQDTLRLKTEEEWKKLDNDTKQEIESIVQNPQNQETRSDDVKSDHLTEDIDSLYFSSYNSVSIHREMLEDKVRVYAYKEAIERNKDYIKGKTVMDVGCGTGILSLFACKAGAKRVIGIEASPWAARMAKLIAEENGYTQTDGSSMLQVIQGKVEEVGDLLEPVDIIISEWMGYCLLFESMLDTVLYARNQWLKPGGKIFPDKSRVLMAGVSIHALDLDFWKNVYGFSMTSIAQEVKLKTLRHPLVHQVSPEQLVTTTATIKACFIFLTSLISAHFSLQVFDLNTMSVGETDFTQAFVLDRMSEIIHDEDFYCHALVFWFDVEFPQIIDSYQRVLLDTSPQSLPTHWAQTVIGLETPMPESIHGEVTLTKSADLRGLDIHLRCWSTGDDAQTPQSVRAHLTVKS